MKTFDAELGRFRYIVMPFGVTVAEDVFQYKLDQCFGKIKVIVIADDIMIVANSMMMYIWMSPVDVLLM